MTPGGEGSVTRNIADLRAGRRDEAAAALWRRYFDRLVRVARQGRARAQARAGRAVEDEEDAALSAFDSFCAGLARGRFSELGSREELWRLLVVITTRKVSAQTDRRRSLKRGGGRTPISLDDPGRDDADSPAIVAADRGPDPGFAAAAMEEFHRLLDALGDDQLRLIALRRMEGHTDDEIAAELGCARRTVARRLDVIRQLWSAEGE